jgi:2-keto-4-pentenoate hydratase/2-oxohepta-3-ene-1,7-dioic acid hydratase in catechol pathway
LNIALCTTPGAAEEPLELRPSKIAAIGVNYRAHAAEMGRGLPAEPIIFLKPPSALLPSGGTILRPGGYGEIHYEGELAVVIGRTLKRVSPERALDGVLGYTCLNDVTARELQKRDGQWARAKGFDTFCPVGPRVVGGLDPTNLRLVTRLNGEVRQDTCTSDLIFSVAELIAFVSTVMTLEPGDLLSTGTPSGVGPIAPGDRVEIEIEGIGTLVNPVAARQGDPA